MSDPVRRRAEEIAEMFREPSVTQEHEEAFADSDRAAIADQVEPVLRSFLAEWAAVIKAAVHHEDVAQRWADALEITEDPRGMIGSAIYYELAAAKDRLSAAVAALPGENGEGGAS